MEIDSSTTLAIAAVCVVAMVILVVFFFAIRTTNVAKDASKTAGGLDTSVDHLEDVQEGVLGHARSSLSTVRHDVRHIKRALSNVKKDIDMVKGEVLGEVSLLDRAVRAKHAVVSDFVSDVENAKNKHDAVHGAFLKEIADTRRTLGDTRQADLRTRRGLDEATETLNDTTRQLRNVSHSLSDIKRRVDSTKRSFRDVTLDAGRTLQRTRDVIAMADNNATVVNRRIQTVATENENAFGNVSARISSLEAKVDGLIRGGG